MITARSPGQALLDAEGAAGRIRALMAKQMGIAGIDRAIARRRLRSSHGQSSIRAARRTSSNSSAATRRCASIDGEIFGGRQDQRRVPDRAELGAAAI